MSADAVHWDLTSYFPSFESGERSGFESAIAADIAALTERARALGPVGGADDDAWQEALLAFEAIGARFSHLSSYVCCLASADTGEDAYAQAEGRLASLDAELSKLLVELRRALAPATDAAFSAFVARPALAHAGYFIGRLRLEGQRSMAPELEALAADLAPTGIVGWSRLYDTIAGKRSFEMRWPDGRVERLPFSARRSLTADPDRAVRAAAFAGGNAGWAEHADVLAAALNHMAGVRHTLRARRGAPDCLEAALHDAGITRRTLEAMLEAVRDRVALPRRGLALKARAMGLPAIAWYDLEAPLPLEGASEANAGRVSWDLGVERVRTAFDRAYPRLARHFDAMLAARWIEAAPSPKKRPGAYCTSSPLTGETRVFMTFAGSLGDVSTLAHEVGHAFHSEVLRDTAYLARQYPMTLAETASTFAEAVLADGLLADRTLEPAARAILLGKVASDAAAFLLDIPTRFYFEKKFYEERASGEVPLARISELMVEAQRAQFGETLAAGEEDPLYWASKLHFFIAEPSFYNFPYTFGYLLSRGLYAAFTAEGAAFLPRYEAFLRSTGKAMAHEVARETLGEDLEQPGFWARAIDSLADPLDELSSLLP
ncbi:MAG: M3 family oligoendopeptidase [Polyangiaceae bacterium]